MLLVSSVNVVVLRSVGTSVNEKVTRKRERRGERERKNERKKKKERKKRKEGRKKRYVKKRERN